MSQERWDKDEYWQVVDQQVKATGQVCDFIDDAVITPSGERINRQYVSHPGAVGIIALDDQDRVAVVRQYRHPVRMVLVEPPAGLLDVEGEDFLAAAQRELAEEAMLSADDWRVLVDIVTTPGGCQESLRIYLARGLHEVPRPEGFLLEGEEVSMKAGWEPLDDLVEAIYAGQCQSPALVTGVMALELARRTERVNELRPAHAPWPIRERPGGIDGVRAE